LITDEEIYESVIRVLTENNGQGFNEIKTQIIKTHRRRLKLCLENMILGNLLTVEVGRNRKTNYFLNFDRLDYLKSLVDNNLNFDKDRASLMIKDVEALCKKCKEVQHGKNHFKQNSSKDIKLFSKSSSHIFELLDGIKLTSFVLATHDLPKSYYDKVFGMQKLQQKTLSNILKMQKKLKISIGVLFPPGLYLNA